MYKVFNIDVCFDEYAMHEVFAGGESVEDVFNHLTDIFPDTVFEIDETCIDDYIEDNPNLKIGDEIRYSFFEEGELDKIKESLSSQFPRIKEVPHLFTDTPYTMLDSFAYIE